MKKLILLILVLSLSSCRSVYTVCPAGCDYVNLQSGLNAVNQTEKNITGIETQDNSALVKLRSGDTFILYPVKKEL